MIERDLLEAIPQRRGHFRYESGHHGDLWLDLDTLFTDVSRVRRWAVELAERARTCAPNWVCGPLAGGAFLAQEMAAELGARFAWSQRTFAPGGEARYRIPDPLRAKLSGQRVLLVDDAVNAGSAWRGTLAELEACGADVVGLACLLALGDAAAELAKAQDLPLYAGAGLVRALWKLEACPPCRAGVPLDAPAIAQEGQ